MKLNCIIKYLVLIFLNWHHRWINSDFKFFFLFFILVFICLNTTRNGKFKSVFRIGIHFKRLLLILWPIGLKNIVDLALMINLDILNAMKNFVWHFASNDKVWQVLFIKWLISVWNKLILWNYDEMTMNYLIIGMNF